MRTKKPPEAQCDLWCGLTDVYFLDLQLVAIEPGTLFAAECVRAAITIMTRAAELLSLESPDFSIRNLELEGGHTRDQVLLN